VLAGVVGPQQDGEEGLQLKDDTAIRHYQTGHAFPQITLFFLSRNVPAANSELTHV
jgi:hypothetical protein